LGTARSIAADDRHSASNPQPRGLLQLYADNRAAAPPILEHFSQKSQKHFVVTHAVKLTCVQQVMSESSEAWIAAMLSLPSAGRQKSDIAMQLNRQ
jgi:hypothetical protein